MEFETLFYHIFDMVFVHYYITYRYIIQNPEHFDHLGFAKQNTPGAD